MVDDRESVGLPASQVVGAVGDEIRKAVVDGTEQAKADMRRIALRWFVAAVVAAIVETAVLCWQAPNVFPAKPTPDFQIEHADGRSEHCVRLADQDGRPVSFKCEAVVPASLWTGSSTEGWIPIERPIVAVR